jgi:hypothetical protein
MLLSQINKAYINNTPISAIYLGQNKVWPPTSIDFLYGFTGDCCVTLTLNSSSTISRRGIIWGDGAISGLNVGTSVYKHSYGTGVC